MSTFEFFKIFWDEYKELPFKRKISVSFVLIVVFVIAASFLFPKAASERIEFQKNIFRSFVYDGGPIVIGGKTRGKIIDLKVTITGDLAQFSNQIASFDEDNNKLDPKLNAWTVAQIAVAIPEELRAQSALFENFLESQRHPLGFGYVEYSGDPFPKVPILAWVIRAKVALGVDPGKDVDDLLNDQSIDGWWGAYIGTTDGTFASSYATALASIALSEFVLSKDFARADSKILPKIANASRWIKASRAGVSWPDYPSRDLARSAYPGLSGLMINAINKARFALRERGETEISEINTDYLDALEYVRSPPDFSEMSGLNVHEGRIDHSRMYFFPNQILGISAAYRSAPTLSRARALSWLDSASNDFLDVRRMALDKPWLAAEYLVAINDLVGD